MNRKKFYHILFLFFAVACCSIQKSYAARISVETDSKTVACNLQEFPNAELERVEQPVTTGLQIAVQKSLAAADLLQRAAFYTSIIASEKEAIKASLQLVKDYLLFIYPSHNFW